MTKSGCEVKEIPNMQFYTTDTTHAVSIINGLVQSNIRYSAKYDEEKLTLVYSLNDESKIKEIIAKAKTDTADLIERIRSGNGDIHSYQTVAVLHSLLPEIADIMCLSTSELESRPAELRLFLAQSYVNYWFCDRATIQEELNRITELGFSAQNELEAAHRQREASNNTPETRKDIHEMEQQLDNAAAVEREILRQQREAIVREEQRTGFFTRDKLRREAERIRRQGQQERQEPIQAEREKK